MKNLNRFSSHDFYLSCVVVAAGGKLSHLERSNGSFVEFVFNEPPEKCHEIIAAYWADELQVSAKKLIASINELKTRLHSGS